MLRVLPTYAELLREMVAYDVVGFQTENDLQSFLAGVEYVWGRDAIGAQGRIHIGTRSVRTGVFPIGIDVPAVEAAASTAAQSDAVRRLSASLLGRKLMVGVDRLDYSKGLIERFAAYQTFLESYPENLGKITFMQVAPLSRTDVRAYAEIRQTLEQSAGRINGRFADADWTPIRYLNRNVPHAALHGLSASRTGSAGDARTRRHESRRQGIRRCARSGGPRCADPVTLGRRSARADWRDPGQSLTTQKASRTPCKPALAMPLAERRDRHAGMMEVLRRNDVTRHGTSASWKRSTTPAGRGALGTRFLQ